MPSLANAGDLSTSGEVIPRRSMSWRVLAVVLLGLETCHGTVIALWVQPARCRQTHNTAVCRIHRFAGWDAAAQRQEGRGARVTLPARRKHEKHGAISMPAARAVRRAVLGAANDEHGRNDGVFRGECRGGAASRSESVAGYVWTGMIRVAPDGLCADECNAHVLAVRGPRLLPQELG